VRGFVLGAFTAVLLVFGGITTDGLTQGALAAGKARGEKRRLVVTPRPGRRVRSHPLRIRVRAGDGRRDLRVRLNGRRIDREFGPERKGVRLGLAGASHGLRHGPNVLRVLARQPGATRWRRATVRFRVARNGPLAGAGRNRRIHVRQRIRLNGSASQSARKRGHRKLRYRWRLLHAPRRSVLRRSHRRKKAVARLARLRAPRPSFRPDVPGAYVFRLTTSEGRRSSSDRVRIDTAPRSWLVTLDTMATSKGQVGISVNGRFYSAGGPEGFLTATCYVQVLVLDRATLGLVANETFGEATCQADSNRGPNVVSRVAKFLGRYDDSKLVIAASQPSFTAPTGFADALGSIGLSKSREGLGTPHEFNRNGKLVTDPGVGGKVSVIGVPGMARGEAQARVVYDDDGGAPGAGALNGYLTPDQYNNFKWLPSERIPFDLRAGSAPPTSPTNTITVGDEKYETSLPQGASGGYQVLILDRRTLQPRGGAKAFDVSASQSVQASHDALKAMHDHIAANMREGDLLFVVSLGAPSAHVESWTVAPALSDLAGLISEAGGTRNNFVWALRNHFPYALLGRGSVGQLNGEEAIAEGSSGQGTRLRGALMIDQVSVFGPRDTSGLTGVHDGLIRELLKSPSTEWPLSHDPEALAALSYIGSQIRQLGPDPRTAYVNKLDWDSITGKVKEESYPGPGHRFCTKVPIGHRCPSFERAKAEMVKEMRLVANVRTYLANVSEPFSSDALVSWAALGSIGETIQKAASAEPNDKVLSLVLDVVGGILDVIPLAFPEALVVQSVIAEVVAVAYATSVEYWTQNRKGGSNDEVQTTASRLGLEMAERFKDAKLGFWKMGNVIVTDPAKLQMVGSIANCNPVHNNSCPYEWAWTPGVETRTSSALLRGTEASFYEELMPLGFPSYRLEPAPDEIIIDESETIPWPSAPSINSFRCGLNYPFRYRNNLATIVLQDATYTPESSTYSTQAFRPYFAYAIGAKKGVDILHPSPAAPPQSILDRMFDPVDPGGEPSKGGLGINRPNYMMHTTATYGPRDPLGTECGWHP
jgi:hypothetical protein